MLVVSVSVNTTNACYIMPEENITLNDTKHHRDQLIALAGQGEETCKLKDKANVVLKCL